jgi:lysophospholipase L1-like esterase
MVSRTSRLASLEGTFDGSKPLVVRVISSYPGGQNNMPVFIDGTFQVDAFGIAYTHVNYTILAGPGSHGFKIWTAQQTRGAAYLGTWVDELDGMGLNVSTNQSASRVLVSLGDSIAGGGNAGNPSRFGINALLRSDFPGRVVDIGYGMLRLFDKTPAAWTADVVRAAGLSGAPRIDVVNLAGTNDYGMPAQSAAAYGSELGAWADAVIAALPAARIVIVEILPRSPEPANAFGDTPAAFRAQQASVVATRASFCQLVTASTMSLTPPDGSDYAGDGLHLSDPGHAKVKARIKSIIGY